MIARISTCEIEELKGKAPNQANGGRKGTKARVVSLTPQQRLAIAHAAAFGAMEEKLGQMEDEKIWAKIVLGTAGISFQCVRCSLAGRAIADKQHISWKSAALGSTSADDSGIHEAKKIRLDRC